ncbi:mycofactocin biosynthesis peptidyl-dipeptidase MftE [Rudaeicoccus suwonensis]|uniref:mycofactocin biosynthesis peptidyl-dipeptidase MftE n=1 Tax=Rudaeicoccus suwonensis TaxID=657409 RepID=UPI001BA6217D
MAPAIEFGASGEHEDFCGTVSIGTEALQTMLLELGRSATRWARGVVFVNGHGGNVTALTAAVERLRYEGRAVAWVPAAPTRGDAHAGRTETSLMLALHPEQVSLAHSVAGPTTSLQELLPRLRAGGVAAVSPSGVLGDPRGASASEGAHLLGQVVADVVNRLRHVNVNERGMLCATEVSV